jgi:REP element-mobilizing transposase RayT
MERKVPFIVGETYHVYTRGIDKRIVCENTADYERLQLLLCLCNGPEVVNMRNLRSRYKGFPLAEILKNEKREGTLADILCYALMPNHLHLLLREKVPGGISKFMLKLMTAYSMYFNIKYERSGTLFTRPFRSKHIDSDQYLRWVFSYILLNPLSLHQHDWESGIRNPHEARNFLQNYPYGSFADLICARPTARILAIDERLQFAVGDLDTLVGQLAKYQGEPFVGLT